MDAKTPNYCEILEINIPIDLARDAGFKDTNSQDQYGNPQWTLKEPIRIVMESDYDGGQNVSGNSQFRRFDREVSETPIYFSRVPTSDTDGNIITYSFNFFKSNNQTATPDDTVAYSNPNPGVTDYCRPNEPC